MSNCEITGNEAIRKYWRAAESKTVAGSVETEEQSLEDAARAVLSAYRHGKISIKTTSGGRIMDRLRYKLEGEPSTASAS